MTTVSVREFSCDPRYVPLVTKGLVKLKGTTTSDLERITEIAVPDDVSPLDLLLAERAEDDR